MLSAISALQERNHEQNILQEIGQLQGQGHQQIQYEPQGHWSQSQGSPQGQGEVGGKGHQNISFSRGIEHDVNEQETNESQPQEQAWNSMDPTSICTGELCSIS